ncbi:sialic acid-binding Ig-like lectin 5 [Scomber scombrus]|uniref:Sialic acid-binding Ig-like lectin 5 n=2 Tax=Scomber scombrus TaxID=13677 RepID=A0AAV1P1M0_SCOSC
MFVLIWMTLLLSVRCSIADAAKEDCHNGSCITLSEANLTAEVGLCVVVPCSFTTNHSFTPERLTWYKFPSEENRNDSQIIFNSNKTNPNVQTGYRGQVSLLEPDLNNMSCSIIINDLTKSDSGSYQVRVEGGLSGATKSSTRTSIVIKDLSQKPTVMVPPLTEGQQTTLTCTAPGLCSGSVPTITWTWRGRGHNTTEIPGKITTENLTAVTQRHSSTLTFNASAKHHGTKITCKVGFTGNKTTEETVTLNVIYVKDLKLLGSTAVEEGRALNLTCRRKSFPPSLIIWTKLSSNKEIEMMNDTGTANLVILNMTAEHSGKYICKAIHLNKTQTKNVTVKYVEKARITGKTTVREGDALNLTCSFPSSLITWTKLGSNKTLKSNMGTATLVILDVTTDHSGQYICTAKHPNNTLTERVDVTVALLPKVLNGSECVVDSGVLTCVCISQGYPLPTIKWPLLENHTDYSVNTTVLKHTVKSTVILTLQDHNNTAVECVCSNKNGEEKWNLNIKEKKHQGQTIAWLTTVTRLDIIVAFFIGGLISATVCCFVRKCHRKKQSTDRHLDETLEMVNSQQDRLIHAGEEVEDDQTHDQEVAEGGAVGKSDVEYSHINISLLKRNNAAKAGNHQETAETEYAEVKKKKVDVGLDGESKGEEVMIEEDEDTKHIQEEKEGEEEALYSSVKDIMD